MGCGGGRRGAFRGEDAVHIVEFDEPVPGAGGQNSARLSEGTHSTIVAHQTTLVHKPVGERGEEMEGEREEDEGRKWWKERVQLREEGRNPPRHTT